MSDFHSRTSPGASPLNVGDSTVIPKDSTRDAGDSQARLKASLMRFKHSQAGLLPASMSRRELSATFLASKPGKLYTQQRKPSVETAGYRKEISFHVFGDFRGFPKNHRCRFSKSMTALVTPPSISRRRSLERVSPTAVTRMAASSVTGHSCSQMPQPMHSAGSM
jgi:hypothetical protein